MKIIPFRAKIWKQGNSYVVTIPRKYIGKDLKDRGVYTFNVNIEGEQ